MLFSLRTAYIVLVGGRGQMFTEAHEAEIIIIVLANNAIRCQEIQSHLLRNIKEDSNWQHDSPLTSTYA